MNCKKEDLGGVKNLGVSVKNRKLLFYGICIWIRLGLVYFAYILRKRVWFPYFALGIGLFSLYTIKFDKDECVWWSRKMHQIILCIILLASIYQVISKDKRPIISILILIDLILGLGSSFILKWR